MRKHTKDGGITMNPGVSRRDIIYSGILGSSALLAGCLGGDEDDDDIDDEIEAVSDYEAIIGTFVEDQELRIPITDNPETISTMWDMTGRISTQYETSGALQQATWDLGMWGNFAADEPDDLYPMMFDSVEVERDEMTITIRDDAYWSDGKPIRAFDGVASRAFHATWIPPPSTGWHPTPAQTSPTGGIIGAEMPDGPDGKVWKWKLQDMDEWRDIGGFEGLWHNIASALLGWNPRIGIQFPTHIEPYKSMAEIAWEEWQELERNHMTSDELAQEYIDDDVIEEFREEKYVSPGAWTIDEFRGTTGIALEPNEHHYHADNINFDRVFLEWVDEDNLLIANLQARRLDYGLVTASPEAVASFPGSLSEVTSPGWTGESLAIDHSSPLWEDVRVRQAAMYAIDAELVAQNVHPTAADAIDVPGGDNWNVTDVLDQDWIDENLIDYSQDLDKAEELMIEAGWERGEDDIWEKDGVRFQTQLATSSDVIILEETIEDQLQDFGMQLSPQTYDTTTFVDRWMGSDTEDVIEEEHGGTGDFEVWAGDFASNLAAGEFEAALELFWVGAFSQSPAVRARNIFDHDVQECAISTECGDGGYVGDPGWVAGQVFLWEDWAIEVPPIGQPDAEPTVSFAPSYVWGHVWQGMEQATSPMSHIEHYDTPHDEHHEENREHMYQMLAWSLNWFLPVFPIVRTRDQHFLNTANWVWPQAIEEQPYEDMDELFGGSNTSVSNLLGMGRLYANPDNPKD